MASINVGEDDFTAIACAAMDAKKAGEHEQAEALDKIARKINAALTAAMSRPYSYLSGAKRHVVRWQDMPSTLEEPHP